MHDVNTRGTWKKFIRNKPALAGMILIIVTAVAALLGYLIMPDETPMANSQMLALSIKQPGSTFTILDLRKNEDVDTAGVFRRMLFGQPAFYRSVPIESYRVAGDSVYFREYIGEDERSDETAKHLSALTGQKAYDHVRTKSPEQLNAYIGEHHIRRQTYWLGTDIYGRDMLSRLILGVRVSLSVGVMAVLISLTIGVVLGALAGYFGGRTDALISWLMNVIWSLPALLLVIAISFALGKGFWQIFIAVGLSMWVDVARLVRGQVMALKNIEFIEASRALGFPDMKILWSHILPNIAGPILVVASSNFASAILLEAGLSFLGFGAQPPMPTWGGMIKEHYGYIINDAAYLAILPGLAIMLLVYAFNLVAVALRDAFDVRSQSSNV